MGIAIIVPNIDLSANNIGKVTYEKELESIAIVAKDSYVAKVVNLSVSYTPSSTSSTGVTWSIESGSEYASIDSNGVLTINSNANASSVVVKATSSVDNSISTTKTIMVTYSSDIEGDVLHISTPQSASTDILNYIKSGYLIYAKLTPLSDYYATDDSKNLLTVCSKTTWYGLWLYSQTEDILVKDLKDGNKRIAKGAPIAIKAESDVVKITFDGSTWLDATYALSYCDLAVIKTQACSECVLDVFSDASTDITSLFTE